MLPLRKWSDQTITLLKPCKQLQEVDDFVAGRTTSTSFELVLDMHNDDIKVSDTKFYFKEGLTLGLDPGYDAGAFNQSSGLSSRLVEQDNGVGMGINAMPVDALSNVIVPLTINQEAGIALKIQIANSTIPEDINVYLEDAIENTFTLLTNESFELFSTNSLKWYGKVFYSFYFKYAFHRYSSSTSLLTAYKGKGNTYISVEGLQQFSEPAQLTLYNVLGMKILSKNIQNPFTKRDAFYSRNEDRSLHPKSTGRKHCFHKKISHRINTPHEKNRKLHLTVPMISVEKRP